MHDSEKDIQAQIAKDKELVDKILRGDERAFREMYRTYAPSLLGRLVQWIGDLQEAEDCLQQVFLETSRSLDKFRGEGRLQSWLHRIATYVVINLFRKKKRMKALIEKVTPVFEVNLKESPALPESLFVREEFREVVHKALKNLSPHKHMAILLCDLEGLSLEEAAEQMKIPLGTVGSRLYHGRRELKLKIAEECQRQNFSIDELMADL